MAATADGFLTNKLPSVRTKLNISVEQIREHNPNIIYVRGTGQGERGPHAETGSSASLAFWPRYALAPGCNRPESDEAPPPPTHALGHSLGTLTIAGRLLAPRIHPHTPGHPPT